MHTENYETCHATKIAFNVNTFYILAYYRLYYLLFFHFI